MHRYTIGKARDQFSRLVRKARSGETVVIYDRDEPVALLCPVPEGFVPPPDPHLEDMARDGRVILGLGTVPDWFMQPSALPPLPGVLQALLEERDESL